jgi:hypothetical protein
MGSLVRDCLFMEYLDTLNLGGIMIYVKCEVCGLPMPFGNEEEVERLVKLGKNIIRPMCCGDSKSGICWDCHKADREIRRVNRNWPTYERMDCDT